MDPDVRVERVGVGKHLVADVAGPRPRVEIFYYFSLITHILLQNNPIITSPWPCVGANFAFSANHSVRKSVTGVTFIIFWLINLSINICTQNLFTHFFYYYSLYI